MEKWRTCPRCRSRVGCQWPWRRIQLPMSGGGGGGVVVHRRGQSMSELDSKEVKGIQALGFTFSNAKVDAELMRPRRSCWAATPGSSCSSQRRRTLVVAWPQHSSSLAPRIVAAGWEWGGDWGLGNCDWGWGQQRKMEARTSVGVVCLRNILVRSWALAYAVVRAQGRTGCGFCAQQISSVCLVYLVSLSWKPNLISSTK